MITPDFETTAFVVRGVRIAGLLAGLAALPISQAATLYWTGGEGVWSTAAENENWATTSGGTASEAWTDGSDVVFESGNPTVTIGSSGALNVSVGNLAIQNGLTLRQGGNPSVLSVTGAGSGDLTLGATMTQLQVRLGGASAWAGRITLGYTAADNRNYLYIDSAASVGTTTRLSVDAGRVIFNSPGGSFTVGELSGSSSYGWVRGVSGANSTLRIEQDTNTTYAGKIGGTNTAEYTLNLVKAGTGTLVLSGNVDHRGTTIAEAGKLYFNGTSTNNLLNGVSVAAGATLGGSGLVGIGGGATRNVNIASGGILAPGGVDTIGTLTINGASTVTSAGLIFSGNATIEVRLGALGQNDKIALTGFGTNGGRGSASGGAGSLLFDFTNHDGLAELGTYDLITFANTPGIAATAFGLAQASIDAGWAGTFGYDGNTLQFTVTEVGTTIPEPAAFAFLAGSALFFAATALRKRHLSQ